jgi:hypothetical protein
MARPVALLGGPATVAGRGRDGLCARTIFGERGSSYIGITVGFEGLAVAPGIFDRKTARRWPQKGGGVRTSGFHWPGKVPGTREMKGTLTIKSASV